MILVRWSLKRGGRLEEVITQGDFTVFCILYSALSFLFVCLFVFKEKKMSESVFITRPRPKAGGRVLKCSWFFFVFFRSTSGHDVLFSASLRFSD